MKKPATASSRNQKVFQEGPGLTKGEWSVSTKDLEINGTHENPGDFEVKSLRQPGMTLSWVADEAAWRLSRDGTEVCRVPGEPPFSDLRAFVSAESPSKDCASKGAARSALGLKSMSGLVAVELRHQCMISVADGDPYGAFCALASGADLVTPMREGDQHPVAAALDRRSNEKGQARLKRPLSEVRGWLDFLGAFGGSLDYRNTNREGSLSKLSVGQFAAWGADEARQVAIERGVDFGPPLAKIMAHSYMPVGEARAQSIFKFLAECGEDGARTALEAVGRPLFDKRDRKIAQGEGAICSFDRQAGKLLGSGHTTAFFAVCKVSPRIDAQWAIQSGVESWLAAQRYEVCKGAKPAAKFQSSLRKLYDGAIAAGLAAEVVGEAVGRALARACQGSKPLAMVHARSRGGLAAIDLSFLGTEAVARGALDGVPSDERGAFDLALLSKAGLNLDHFEVWASGSALADDAKAYVEHARAERAANELRSVLDEAAPSPKRASGRRVHAL